MKTILIPLLLIAGLNPAHAEDTTAIPSAEQARATWSAMTPEQQAAAKAMAKTQADSKKTAWGALSDEEKSATQAAAREAVQPYRDAMQTTMRSRSGARAWARR